jgi:CRP-like cAMP-binding protein
MSMSPQPQGPARNRLLAALPREEYERLLPQLEIVSLTFNDSIYQPGEPIPHVYFPLSGVLSLLTILANGTAIEVATIGNEGMVGLPVFLGAVTTPGSAIAQVPGEAMRMKAEEFREEISRGSPLHALLHRYTQAMFHLIAQTAACNRVHSITERCSRWLLMTHDRVGSNQFVLTQEFLAQMLGVHRPRVNAVARALQGAGLIRYSRGRITILDREGLEAASCECFQVIKGEFDRLLG